MVRPSDPSLLEIPSTSRQVRVRDKNWAGLPFFGGQLAMLLISCAGVATVVLGSGPPGNHRSPQSSEAERARLHEATVAATDRIAAEAHAKLPRSKASSIGAIYVRFSTLFQDSAIDQIRELFDYAVKNQVFVPREFVFFDLGVRGYKNQRAGLNQARALSPSLWHGITAGDLCSSNDCRQRTTAIRWKHVCLVRFSLNFLVRTNSCLHFRATACRLGRTISVRASA
jgi:hypothetical protein